MANSYVHPPFPEQLGQGPNNWYQSCFDPALGSDRERRSSSHGSRCSSTNERRVPTEEERFSYLEGMAQTLNDKMDKVLEDLDRWRGGIKFLRNSLAMGPTPPPPPDLHGGYQSQQQIPMSPPAPQLSSSYGYYQPPPPPDLYGYYQSPPPQYPMSPPPPPDPYGSHPWSRQQEYMVQPSLPMWNYQQYATQSMSPTPPLSHLQQQQQQLFQSGLLLPYSTQDVFDEIPAKEEARGSLKCEVLVFDEMHEMDSKTSDDALVIATVVEPTDVVVGGRTTSECPSVENEGAKKTNVEYVTPTDERLVQLENEVTYVWEDTASVSTEKGVGSKDGALCEYPKELVKEVTQLIDGELSELRYESDGTTDQSEPKPSNSSQLHEPISTGFVCKDAELKTTNCELQTEVSVQIVATDKGVADHVEGKVVVSYHVAHGPLLHRLCFLDKVEEKGLKAMGFSCPLLEELQIFPADPFDDEVLDGEDNSVTEIGFVAISKVRPNFHYVLYFCRHVTNAACEKIKSLAKAKELDSCLILLINGAWAATKESTVKDDVLLSVHRLLQPRVVVSTKSDLWNPGGNSGVADIFVQSRGPGSVCIKKDGFMVWDPGPTSVQVINIHVITTLVPPQDITMKVEAMKSLVAILRSMRYWMNKQLRIPYANSLKHPTAVMGNVEGGNDLSDVSTESAELTQATKIEKDGFMVWDPGIGH